MARSTGANTSFTAAIEASEGVQATAGIYKMPFKTHDLGAEKTLGTDSILGQGRNAQDPYYNSATVTGQITVPCDVDNIGMWLRCAVGKPTTTERVDGDGNGIGVYDHVFLSGQNILDTLSLQASHDALTPVVHYQHLGCKIGSVGLSFSNDGVADMDLNFIAVQEIISNVNASSNPASRDFTRFSQSNGAISINGGNVGAITAGSFEFNNNLEAINTIRADGLIEGIDEGEATATGSLTVRYDHNAVIEGAGNDETPIAIQYRYGTAGTSALVIDCPRVFLPKQKKSISGPGGIEATYDWQAAFDQTAGYLMKITLTNETAGY